MTKLTDEYVTISQAAKAVNVTRQTISRWIRQGKIPAEKIGRETLLEKERLFLLYDEKMRDYFSESIDRWMRRAATVYLREKNYVSENSTMIVAYQSVKRIKIVAWEKDGSRIVFDIPIGQMRFVIDREAKELLRLKTAKVIVKSTEGKETTK
jgi:excisionase family DNA binding protein